MADIAIYESFDGGEVILKGGDLELTEGLFNHPYLGMFGGNVEQSHEDEDEFLFILERFDYWGNNLFFPDDPQQQFNSELERVLTETALDDEGLQRLEAIIKADLDFLTELAEVSVSVELLNVDTLKIDIFLQQPGGLQEQRFVFLWDGTRLEQITNLIDAPSIPQNPIETFTGEGGEFLTGEGGELLTGEP